ncbi:MULTISPECIES: 2-C-methyl-D-erythritol 4-phosphate cytidylyltransferase [Anaerofustis]|uniref:2-C-methyl-D-erythritol 4-phosphate cytidylyltransferase n=1 Tax=Anaerofustis TaxID=264995 RepID=UPI001105A749|nr:MULTISPECIES: 2-C-methyl-D-erythritol 4-phosphate cytidylyltransferase [Anaerofustis]MCO8194450.1 2-C-methyl-D-erythritol 4-phosphate cytidylyltransferase [Anaerofustis sp. NSJ-163]
MNIAIITASGRGTRMGEEYKDSPKQFLDVEGKPVLFYCLEKFENNNNIDAIIIVTLKDYISFVQDKVNEYDLKKVKAIVQGGDTLKQSIMKGFEKAKDFMSSEDDTIVIHDGVRPMVFDSVITDIIKSAKEKGPSLTGIPNKTGNFMITENSEVNKFYTKNQVYAGGTPQALSAKDLQYAYNEGIKRNILDDENYGTCFISLLYTLGKKIYIVQDKELMNLKITTPAELEIFRAIIRIREEKNK